MCTLLFSTSLAIKRSVVHRVIIALVRNEIKHVHLFDMPFYLCLVCLKSHKTSMSEFHQIEYLCTLNMYGGTGMIQFTEV